MAPRLSPVDHRPPAANGFSLGLKIAFGGELLQVAFFVGHRGAVQVNERDAPYGPDQRIRRQVFVGRIKADGGRGMCCREMGQSQVPGRQVCGATPLAARCGKEVRPPLPKSIRIIGIGNTSAIGVRSTPQTASGAECGEDASSPRQQGTGRFGDRKDWRGRGTRWSHQRRATLGSQTNPVAAILR